MNSINTYYEKSAKRRKILLSAWCIAFSLAIFTAFPAGSSDNASFAEDDNDSADMDEKEKLSAEEQASTTTIRENIISLIEDDLSNAYSYTNKSSHRLPHFEVIDEIFPQWHQGNPAVARQFWLSAGYRRFLVFYRVDYVEIVNDMTAKVAGKRLVIWSEKEDELEFEKYWPFQLWAALQKQTYRDNTYLSAAYTMRYQMKLSLNETGKWFIVEERILENPEMMNNIKDNCTFKKQMADWGLKNDCDKKLLSK